MDDKEISVTMIRKIPNGKRVWMVRSVTVSMALLILFFLNGCGNGSQADGSGASPRLMNDGAQLRGIARSAPVPKTVHYPENNALKLKAMEIAHRERLSAIEAEKEKALKALELEKLRSVEEIRRRTREIETENALKLEKEKRRYAALIAEKEKAIKALEANASLHRDETQMAITRLETGNRLKVESLRGKYETEIAALNKELKERYLWAAIAIVLILLLFWFLFYRYRRAQEAKQREEERRHEAWLLESRQQHERIEKILEIIASSETDDAVKVELTRLLQQGNIDPNDPRLIEYKKKD